MFKKALAGFGAMLAVVMLIAATSGYGTRRAAAEAEINSEPMEVQPATDGGFSVEVLINGVPAEEYAARGRRYIEAFENAEYELRIRNPTGSRVAVALAVDGLNTIDARHTSAWDGHKWVIEPYGTIHVRGWQMSSENARRFYFTTERDSYAAKLGQAANLGVISAVFFRERRPITVMPVDPRPDIPADQQGEKRASRKQILNLLARAKRVMRQAEEPARVSAAG